MLVSINWIKEFVDLKGLNIENLIEKFTLSTAEIEKIYHKGENLSGVITAKIVSVKSHPESKKLHLLKVNTGKEIVDVVCGAPNVEEGMVTAFAKVGADVLGKKINKIKLANFESNGMCCSGAELGISCEDKGIMKLSSKEKLGINIKKILNIEDIIFEIDNKSLTNRPDLWGIYGIAREFAAISGRKLKLYKTRDLSIYNNLSKPEIEILSNKVLRYSGIKIENISKKTSDENMKIRLFYSGIRSINLLTDLTNYVMLELGQPMHAFDSSKIENIIVKCPKDEIEFITLDNIKRKIKKETLMIYSEKNPAAIAGIMGGLNFRITDSTTSLFLESATFDAISIRKTSTYLSHRTDASTRYEKSLDPEMTTIAISRFIDLLLKVDLNIKIVSSLCDIYKNPHKTSFIDLDKNYINKYIGTDIPSQKIKNILESLDFKVVFDNNNFKVTVPKHRATKDIKIKADLVEEIARIYGYDNFETKPSLSPLAPVKLDDWKDSIRKIQDELVLNYNLNEVHSYLWQDEEKFKEIKINVEENTKIINASNPNHKTLRTSLIPTLLTFIFKNREYSKDFGIFEIGSIIDKEKERKKLGIVLFSKSKKEEELFFNLKNILSNLSKRIKNVELDFENVKESHAWQHPKNTVKISFNSEKLGSFGTIHPEIIKNIDKNSNIVVAELDIKNFSYIKKIPTTYKEISKFPSIQVDLSFVIDKKRGYKDIKSSINKVKFLNDVTLIDIFDLQNEKESLTLRLDFASKDRTLLNSEIDPLINDIIEKLKNKNIYLKDKE